MLRVLWFVVALTVPAGVAQAAPIHDAAAANDATTIMNLVESGVDVDSLNEAGETALIVAAKTARPDAVNMLVQKRANPDFVDPSGRRALHWVVLSGDNADVVNCIRFLYEKLADMNARDADGATALILAADQGHGVVVTLLPFDLGIDIEVADNAGMTALTRAGLKGYKTIVTVLLRVGAKCQTIDPAWSAACEARKAELGLK